MIGPGSLCKIVPITTNRATDGTQLGPLSPTLSSPNALDFPFLKTGTLVTITGIMPDPNDNGELRYVVLTSVNGQPRLGWLYMAEVEEVKQ